MRGKLFGMILGATVSVLPATAPPAAAQTLTMGVQSTFGIDPHFFFIGPNMAAARHIFDTFVGRDENSKQVPSLALSWKLIEPTVWEFKLRQGVTFQDGSPFTAEDVAFSIARIPNVPNNIGPYTINLRTIQKVEIVDPYTIRVHTSEPNPILPGQMTNVFIVSAKTTAQATTADFNSGKAAIGTGPYRVISHDANGMKLARYDGYYGPRPDWSEVNIKVIPNDASRLAGLLAGDLDLIEDVALEDVKHLRQEGNVNVFTRASDRGMYLFVNVAKDSLPLATDLEGKPLPVNPLSDVRVRQSISLAIDHQALVERVMDGLAVASSQVVPEGFGGYDPNVKVSSPDIAQARRLLTQAGYPNGFGLTVSCSNDRYVNDAHVCQALGQMLSRIGLQMKVDASPGSVFFQHMRGERIFLPLALTGRSFSSGDASYVLSTSFHSRDLKHNLGGANRSGFSDPTIDQEIRDVMVRIDPGRDQALVDLMHKVSDMQVQIPLYVEMTATGTRKGISYTPRLDEQTIATSAHLER